MKNITAIVFSLLVFVQIVKAQEQPFNIKDYKFPDIVQYSLNSDPRIGFYDRNHNEQMSLPSQRRGFNISVPTNFQLFSNTRKYQKHLSISNRNSVFLQNQQADLEIEKLSRTSSETHVTYFSRKFNGKSFLEFEHDLNFEYDREKSELANTVVFKQESEKTSLDYAANIWIGRGRVENVTFYHLAKRIARVISKFTNKEILANEKELNDFAYVLAKIKTKYFLTTRLRNMYQRTQLIAALQDKGITDSELLQLMPTIEDYFFYEANIVRQHGWLDKFGIGGELYTTNTTNYFGNSFTSEDGIEETGFQLAAEFNYHNAVSSQFQINSGINLYTLKRFRFEELGFRKVRAYSNHFAIETSLNLLWFANARTYISVSHFNRFEIENTSLSKAFETNIGANYFMSPLIRFRVELNHIYRSSSQYEINNIIPERTTSILSISTGFRFFIS